MIREDLRQLSTTPRDLRKFGLLVGGVFLLLAGWFAWRHKPIWPYFLAPGGFLFLVGAVFPRALRPFYLVWMALALVLGLVVSTLLLIFFFLFVVTPIGWVARIAGQDFLSLKLDRGAASYWLKKDQAPKELKDYEHQY